MILCYVLQNRSSRTLFNTLSDGARAIPSGCRPDDATCTVIIARTRVMRKDGYGNLTTEYTVIAYRTELTTPTEAKIMLTLTDSSR